MLLSRRTSEFRELAIGVMVGKCMAWLVEMLHMAVALASGKNKHLQLPYFGCVACWLHHLQSHVSHMTG
jgi:hypothetical protein